jgi:transcriptional regulator with XRE-family HTH domain
MTRHPIVSALVDRRRRAGLTQRQVAHLVCRSPRALSHFETDKGGRHLVFVEEVAHALGARLVLVDAEPEQPAGAVLPAADGDTRFMADLVRKALPPTQVAALVALLTSGEAA